MKIIILAGGTGTRLWPLSRINKPKQVQPFLDSHTLLQHTWERLSGEFKTHDIFVSTVASQVKAIKQQLPKLHTHNIIIEPAARNTAAAIGLAARVIEQKFPGEVMAVVSSDHFIKNSKTYLGALRVGERIIKIYPDHLLLLGIIPTYAETGYGYIKLGSKIKKINAYKVTSFAEKPSIKIAQQYIKSKKYLWNAGLFVFFPKMLLKIIREVAPKLDHGLKVSCAKHTISLLSNLEYTKLPSISFDYAIVEKTKKLLTLPIDCGWTDVGHWRTIYDILSSSPDANVIRGKHVGVNSQGNLVYGISGKLVATVGVSDSIIIETNDAILICPKKDAQSVRLLVEKLKKQKLHHYL